MTVLEIRLAPDQLDALAELVATKLRPAQSAEWLDAKGAAAVLGITPRQVQKLAKATTVDGKTAPPKLRASKVGRLLRFARADVEALRVPA